MATSISRSEEAYVVPEATYGTQEPARPVGTDAIPFIRLTMPRNQQFLARNDKLGTRTRLQPVAGGNIEATVDLEAYLIPSGMANTAPDTHDLIKSAFGATATINTTVATASSPTSFTVASATGITAGSILLIGNEARPVASIAGVTVTMAIGYTNTPSVSATVKGINYSLADPVAAGLDVYKYDGQDNLSRVATGTVVNRANFQVDTVDRILQMALACLAANVTDLGSPASPAKPTAATVGLPISSSFGVAYVGGVSQCIFQASVVLDNGDARRRVCVGSQSSSGISRGNRAVTANLSVYLDAVTRAYYGVAVNRTASSLFIQIGNTAGAIFALWCPTMILQIPEPDDSEAEVILPIEGWVYGTSSNEIFAAVC